MSVLECSSAGDKRFSAFYAKVDLFGKYDTIENHYQSSKIFIVDGQMQGLDKPKGKRPACMVIRNSFIDVKYLTPFYRLLWFIYLDNNPDLVTYLSRFDNFTDKFAGKKVVNSQADAIRMYMQEDWADCMASVKPFLDATGLTYVNLAGRYRLCRKLYTLGYSSLGPNGPDALEKLRRVADKRNAVVVDVRFKPFSGYYSVFNFDNMMRSGISYVWLENLGNLNYQGGPYKLKSEQAGLRTLCGILEQSDMNVILFCSEKDPRRCHRRYIAGRILDSQNIIHLIPRGYEYRGK